MKRKKHVLIVDDNEFVCATIERIVRQHGVRVTIVADGKRAKKELRRMRDIDVVFLDLFLPYVPGWELLDIIQDNPEMRETPVVIVSSAPLPQKDKEELADRVTAYVDKDTFDYDEFGKLVEKVLSDEPAHTGDGK